ncbi:MAG: 2-amino-4-hydroxy-6-hydroxymethyldihydropteridine diphosphokinase [Bacteroidota bacterium]|nr:2-amino-4-hydroxy-6-hydroxymethyldihydropteridine diphosphokinase [Bacteroidota bacterium]
MMNTIFLITGGNLGDRQKNLQTAATLINQKIGEITISSSIYETEAWGNTDQPSFYNQVHIIKSNLSAANIMNQILQIEKQMGRIRTIKNAARIIDIDILFFNTEIINKPDLIVPHIEISNRRFVLLPLNEIAPKWIHPALHKNITELLSTCKDPLKVIPLPSS